MKIDQRFVHGLEQNKSDEAIAQAIIALSDSLGLRCIAEGVETIAQFEFLKNHRCEEAQGYLISRPPTHFQEAVMGSLGIHADLARGVKRVFDPNGIIDPGRDGIR